MSRALQDTLRLLNSMLPEQTVFITDFAMTETSGISTMTLPSDSEDLCTS
jgi:hypothetical protein